MSLGNYIIIIKSIESIDLTVCESVMLLIDTILYVRHDRMTQQTPVASFRPHMHQNTDLNTLVSLVRSQTQAKTKPNTN